MSDRTIIECEAAPKPIGPYSQAVKAGSMLFLAGQIPIDPASGQVEATDITEQTKQVMKNIQTIIEYAGLTMGHIVRCVIYLTDLNDFAVVNEIYGEYFVFEPPVRSTVQVAALPAGSRIEIEVTAYCPAA